MSIPFENNTSAVVKNMAKKNLRSDRKKNIFYIMAISIAVTIVVIVSLTVQNILRIMHRCYDIGLHGKRVIPFLL